MNIEKADRLNRPIDPETRRTVIRPPKVRASSPAGA